MGKRTLSINTDFGYRHQRRVQLEANYPFRMMVIFESPSYSINSQLSTYTTRRNQPLRMDTRDYNHDVVWKILATFLSSRSKSSIAPKGNYFMHIRIHSWYSDDEDDYEEKVLETEKEGVNLLLIKAGSDLLLEGVKGSVENISKALSRTIFHSTTVKDVKELKRFAVKYLKTPDNIHYALENGVPYHWFDQEYSKFETRLKIEPAGDDEYSIELFEGQWGTISTKDLSTFLNFYHHGKRGGSWRLITPHKLYERLTGNPGSVSDVERFMEHMKNNSGKSNAEERAQQLLSELLEQYPDRIRRVEDTSKSPTTGAEHTKYEYHIKGKMCDWKIVDRNIDNHRESLQNVSSFVWQEKRNKNRLTLAHEDGTWFTKDEVIEALSRPEVFWDSEGEYPYTIDIEGKWAGPICIDNLMGGSPKGDQIASRIMSFMNDHQTSVMVSTIGRYLTDKMRAGEVRTFDW